MTSALSRRRQWRRLSPIRPLLELRWSTRGCEQEPCRLRFINASRSKSWDDGEIERRIGALRNGKREGMCMRAVHIVSLIARLALMATLVLGLLYWIFHISFINI